MRTVAASTNAYVYVGVLRDLHQTEQSQHFVPTHLIVHRQYL